MNMSEPKWKLDVGKYLYNLLMVIVFYGAMPFLWLTALRENIVTPFDAAIQLALYYMVYRLFLEASHPPKYQEVDKDGEC